MIVWACCSWDVLPPLGTRAHWLRTETLDISNNSVLAVEIHREKFPSRSRAHTPFPIRLDRVS